MNSSKSLLVCVGLLGLAFLSFQSSQNEKFEKLFNGKDFTGWYSFVDGSGKDSDPLKVFRIEPDGIIHVSGEKFGYLCTNTAYTDFHIKLEFRWGKRKWEPRLTQKRDGGLLYLVPTDSIDKIWPCGIECQIQEGDTGDFWMTHNSTIVIDGLRTDGGSYVRAIKRKDAEKPNGEWNSVEVIVRNGHCQHIVNGVLVNEGFEASLASGKILIQSEGAEIYYRDIQLKKLR